MCARENEWKWWCIFAHASVNRCSCVSRSINNYNTNEMHITYIEQLGYLGSRNRWPWCSQSNAFWYPIHAVSVLDGAQSFTNVHANIMCRYKVVIIFCAISEWQLIYIYYLYLPARASLILACCSSATIVLVILSGLLPHCNTKSLAKLVLLGVRNLECGMAASPQGRKYWWAWWCERWLKIKYLS